MTDPCTLPFIVLGFFRASPEPYGSCLTHAESCTYGGEVGAVSELHQWATRADAYWTLMDNAAEPDSYADVFAYDVAEEFGVWLRGHGTANTSEARAYLAHLIAEGFTARAEEAARLVALCEAAQ